MACLNALVFCVTHRGCDDEPFLANELSRVRSQVSKGLSYFNESSPSPVASIKLKEQVRHLITTLSTFLGVSEAICHEIFVHFLATQGNNNHGSQPFVLDGRMSGLFHRIRLFYWQERLALCGLLKLALCNWHDEWSSIADVLFALTSYETRAELINAVLDDYLRVVSETETLVKGQKCITAVSGRFTASIGGAAADFEAGDDFDAVLSQQLKEQIELLQVILVGIHVEPQPSSSTLTASSFFTKFMESFWSHSLGLHQSILRALVKRASTVDQICFLQTLILIRCARLDDPSLFRRSDSRSKSRQTPSRLGRSTPGSSRTTPTAEPTTPHFLSDARLLNRLLVSLSDLGNLPVHGPLLLFGAVCASSFAPSPTTVGEQRTDEEVDWVLTAGEDHGPGAISETAQLLAGQYGQLAIESLHVFDFLMEQLDGFDRPSTNSNELCDGTAARFDTEATIGLVDFCAHVAVFDLLTLLARDVVLWSLDSKTTALRHSTELFGPPNQTAFVQLVAKALHVVVQHAQYASSQPQITSTKRRTGESGSGIGNRLATLIESLTEVFPQRLSILRLCSALMIPGTTVSSRSCASSLVKFVSELVSCMPYLSEPFTSELSAMLTRNSTAWYPSLDGGGDLSQTSEVVLTQPYAIWQNEDRFEDQRKLPHSTKLQLPIGTHGIIRSDLGLIIWKYDHSVWRVFEREIQLTWVALDPMDKSGLTFLGLSHSQSFLHGQRTQLYTRLLRLFEFARFAEACIESNVHLPACLNLLGKLWPLLTHLLDLVAQKPLETGCFPEDPELDIRLNRLLLNQIAPTVLRLLGTAMNNLATEGSIRLFRDHISLWRQLFSDRATLFPRVLDSRNVQSNKTELKLTSSHITKQLVPDAQPQLLDFGQSSDRVPSFGLIISYLDLTSGLQTLTKWCCTLRDSVDASLLHEAVELLRGAILLIVQHLLPEILHPDKWSYVSDASKHASGLYSLAEKCLILLTDLLTTSPMDADSLETFDLLSTDAILEALQPTGVSHAVVKLRRLALFLLLNNRSALDSLLALSSTPLRTLLARFKTLEHGLTISSTNRCSLASSQSHSGRLSRITWLAIILVHHLLNLEHAWFTRHSSSANSEPPLLSSVRGRVNPNTREHYVATLFQYLYYPYNVGLSRGSVTLLKWMVQYSDMNLVNFLGDQTQFVRSVCLQRLASSTDDQLTRASLFDLVAESILCCDQTQENNGQLKLRRPTGLLRLLLTSPIGRGPLEDPWFGTVLPVSTEKEKQELDLFKCCLNVLQDAKDKSKSGSMDQLTSLCLRNVAKLIASLYLQDLQTCITTLKNEPNFWELITYPLMASLGAVKSNEKLDFSNVENELCGHIVSILALELFNTPLQQSTSNLDEHFRKALAQLAKQGAYTSWFKLVAYHLQQKPTKDTVGSNPKEQTNQPLLVHLEAVHDATCRWKCLFVLHLKLVQTGTAPPDVALDVNPIVVELLNCLRLLNDVAFESGTSALAGQLGACLTAALQHQVQCHSKQHATDIDNLLGQLVYLVLQFRPDPDEQTQHMHADLLASCSLLLHMTRGAVETRRSADNSQQVSIDLLHCVFAYMAPLSACTKLTIADELALRQCINLVMQLWTNVGPELVADRLVQSGILHNLFQTMTQYSKLRYGTSLCCDILNLVNLLVLPCSTQNLCVQRSIYPDLDAAQFSVDEANGKNKKKDKNTQLMFFGAELVASYAPLLSQALIWPPPETLVQWIREDEASSNVSQISISPKSVNLDIPSVTIGPDSRSIPISGGWTVFLLTQLRLLCSLYDTLGGLSHPFVGQLLHTFCTENAAQFESVLTLWSETLYNTSSLTPTLLSPLPPTASLFRDGFLSPSRLHLAESLCSLLWRVLLSGQSLGISPVASGSGLPTLGMNILFRTDVDANRNSTTDTVRYAPTYGPPCSSQFAAAVFSMAEFQVRVCTILFERTGYRPGVKTVMGGTPNHTPSKSSQIPDARTRSVASPSRPITPLRKTALDSPQLTVTDVPAGADSTGEAELEFLVRHLVTALSLLIIQLPSLGYLSLLSSEELHELRSPIQLVFNSPSLDDTSFNVSFGVLLNLAHSLGYLISKIYGHCKLTEPSSTGKDKTNLKSLLVQAHEMTVSLICSQATLVLASAQTSPADKQLLLRELAGELKSSTVFGRPTRRCHRSSTMRSSRSPRSRSSSVVQQRAQDSSPHTSASVSVVGAATQDVVLGTKLCTPDLTTFDFEQAVDRFAELLRVTV